MKVIFLQLNEINFEVVNEYIKIGYDLDYFKKILKNGIDTFENEVYENLEPWIQWFSIFKGKPYKNHKVYRLGDGLKSLGDNLYTDVRNKLKKKCGAVCPMNISSKEVDFDFFIPDPWSCEKIKGAKSLNLINESIKQGVNNNSGGGLNLINKIKLIAGLFLNLNIQDLKNLFLFFKEIKGVNYRKALFLDYILVLLQKNLTKKNKTEFTSIFLNGGAHIQHHYFLNSRVIKNKITLRNPSWYMEDKIDPIAEMLIFYNKIIKSYEEDGYEIILMTGLQQIPYTSINYYYRLINHKKFFKFLGIKNKNILPRMTRDFEILFENNCDRDNCLKKISKITDINGIKLFGDVELRENSIFTSLTYRKEITESKLFFYEGKAINIFYYVNFVAIKNGKHHKKGKLYLSQRNLLVDYPNPMELSTIRSFLLKELSKMSN